MAAALNLRSRHGVETPTSSELTAAVLAAVGHAFGTWASSLDLTDLIHLLMPPLSRHGYTNIKIQTHTIASCIVVSSGLEVVNKPFPGLTGSLACWLTTPYDL